MRPAPAGSNPAPVYQARMPVRRTLTAQVPSSRRRPSSGTTGRAARARSAGGASRWVGGDLAFLFEPLVVQAQHLVAGGGGGRLPAGEQVSEEGFQVGALRVGQADVAGGEEPL